MELSDLAEQALILKFGPGPCDQCESTWKNMIEGQWTGVDHNDETCIVLDDNELCHCEADKAEAHVTTQCYCRRWTASIGDLLSSLEKADKRYAETVKRRQPSKRDTYILYCEIDRPLFLAPVLHPTWEPSKRDHVWVAGPVPRKEVIEAEEINEQDLNDLLGTD